MKNIKINIIILSAALAVMLSATTAGAATGYGGYTGGGSSAPYISNTTLVQQAVPIAQTPQAVSYVFIKDLQKGDLSIAVIELQHRLKLEGFFTYPVLTGFYGAITYNAVKKYQAAHPDEIGVVTGYVGPLTRAVLNK